MDLFNANVSPRGDFLVRFPSHVSAAGGSSDGKDRRLDRIAQVYEQIHLLCSVDRVHTTGLSIPGTGHSVTLHRLCYHLV